MLVLYTLCVNCLLMNQFPYSLHASSLICTSHIYGQGRDIILHSERHYGTALGLIINQAL